MGHALKRYTMFVNILRKCNLNENDHNQFLTKKALDRLLLGIIFAFGFTKVERQNFKLQNVTSEVNTICNISLRNVQVTYTLVFVHHSRPFSLVRGKNCIIQAVCLLLSLLWL